MNWSSWIRSLFPSVGKKHSKPKKRASLSVEHLEERLVPYSASGSAWPNQQLITISFMPDGTPLSSAAGSTITSNLFSTFNAKFGSPAAWENQILRAAQVWAQQTNINFSVVPDNGAPSGSGSYQQGDPGFGDIRIGGYAFSNSQLGNTYFPPQSNNYSIAGDVALNTGQTWNIGSTYDLFTVASHEIGHALGLGDSSAATSAIMYGSYTGIKTSLSSDDIAGIQNIYSNNGPRTPDAYDTGSGDNSVATAANISSLINATAHAALVQNLNIVTTADIAYYTFTAPAGTSSTLQVQVQSQGLSLLSPKVTVYAANGTTVLGSASGLNQYGTTLDVTVTGVTAGEKFYVKVQGADTTAFSTGDYALALNFGTGTTPVEASPIVAIANGSPITGSGGVAQNAGNGNVYQNSVPAITGITPDNGLDPANLITNAQNINLVGTAPANNTVNVYAINLSTGNRTLLGTTTVGGGNNWTFNYTWTTLAPGNHTFTATATDPYGNVSNLANSVTVTIDTSIPKAPTITGISPDTGFSAADGITNVTTPTLHGTAPVHTLVQIYQNNGGANGPQLVGSTMTASNGTWSFPTTSLNPGTSSFLATAESLAGNVSLFSSALSVTIDTQAPAAPVITGITPDTGIAGDGATNSPIITLMGTAAPNTRIQVFNGALAIGTTTTGSNGTWQFNYTQTTLSQGTYQFTAQATDIAGNVSSLSHPYQVIIQTTPPAAPVVTSISNDSGVSASDFITNVQTQTFNGTSTAPNGTVQVFLDGTAIGTTTVGNNGSWSFAYTTPISLGTHTVTAQVTDYVGNVGPISAPLTLVIDLTAPNMPVITGWGSYTGNLGTSSTVNVNTPYVVGTAEAYSTVTVMANGQPLGTTTTNAAGAWQFISPQLSANVYSITAKATDLAGNTGQACAAITIGIASSFLAPLAPSITGLTPQTDTGIVGDNLTNNPNIQLVGAAVANSSVVVFCNGNVVGTTNANGGGIWNFDYSHTTLAPGSYSFTASAMDALGNISQQSHVCTVVIQTTPPAAPAVTGISADSGASSTDLITNVLQQIFSGTSSTPNGTVQVFLDGHTIGTATTNGNGNWSFDYRATNISQGTHTVTAQVTDYVGNVSALSAALTLVIDLTAPNTPQITSWGPNTGSSTTDFTNVNTPTFSGTAEANSTVTVLNNGRALGTTTANANGNWQFTSPALQGGVLTITATATDAAGNTSQASNPLTFTIDTKAPSAPAITGITPDSGIVGDGVTNSQNIRILGNGVANTTVMVLNNGTSIGTTVVNSSGAWSFDYSHTTLAAGTYQLTAMTIDQGGNVSVPSQAYTVVIDLTPPPAPAVTGISNDSGASSTDSITNVPYQDFSGTCSTPNGTIQVFLDGHAIGTTTANNNGTWSFNYSTTAIQSGTHTITAQVTDPVGNKSALSAPLTLDIDLTTPNSPQITSWGPDTGSSSTDGITDVNTPTFYGTALANSTVTVLNNGQVLGTTTANAAGAWQFIFAQMGDGVHTITATVTDIVGNISQASSQTTFTIDTQAPRAPAVTGVSPDTGTVGDGVTNSQNIQILGTSVANSTVQVFSNGIAIGTTQVNGSGTWQFDYSHTTLAAGTYSFTATAIDVAGNVSNLSQAYTAVVDLTAPATPAVTGISNDSGVSATDGITNVPYQTFYGTSIPNGTVQVFLDGKAIGTVATGNGNWSFNYSSTAIQAGTHQVTAQVTDYVGNLSAMSAPFTLVIDLTAPNQPVITSFSPASGPNTTNVNTPTFFGTAEAYSTVTVMDTAGGQVNTLGTTTASAAGAWSFTCNQLNNAVHVIAATATDLAGNVSQASATLTVTVANSHGAPNPPAISGITPDSGTVGDGVTNNQNIKLVGTADANATIQVFCNALSIGSTTTNINGNWTFDYSKTTLPAGTYAFTAQEINAAGVASQLSRVYTVVIDLMAPATPSVTGISADSGASATDGITNVPYQMFNGTCSTPNWTVQVFLDGKAIGTTTAGPNGTWSFDYRATAISAGTHTVTAQVTDYVGNVSALSGPMTLVVDLTAPLQPSITSWGPDTGSSATDGITNCNTPTVYGTAEAYSTVTVLDGGHALGTTTASAAGAWQYTVATLGDGVHAITATATDLAGNTGQACSATTITIITKAPAAPAISGITPDSGVAGDGVTNSRNIQILGTGVANTTVQVLSNGTAVGTTQVGGNGTWQFDYSHTTLAAGTYNFTAQTIDLAGNVSLPSQTYTVVIDLTPPAAPAVTDISSDSGASATDNITNVQSQIFSGTSSTANGTVQVFLNGKAIGTTTVGPNGSWSFNYSQTKFNQGTYLVTAEVTDYVGNVSALSAPFNMVIDLTTPNSPQITSWGPETGSSNQAVTNVNTPTVHGTALANSTVTVLNNGQPLGTTTANAVGVWQYTSPCLSDGVASITATATDIAGNTSQASNALSFTILTKAPQAPAITGITPDTGTAGDGVTRSQNIQILGTGVANTTVQVFKNGTSIGTTTVSGSGNWTFNYSKTTLPTGTYLFTAETIDVAGNISQASRVYTVVIDLTPPATPAVTGISSDSGASATDGITNVQFQTFSGTCSTPNGTVQIFLDGHAIGTTTTNGNGVWSFNYNQTAISQGTHLITAQVTDQVGNVSAMSAPFTLVIDLTAPIAPLITSWGPDTGVSSTDGITNVNTPTVYGTAEPYSTVTVLDGGHALGTTTANAAGAWQYTSSQLNDGVHTITATATDLAGNTSQASQAISITIVTKIGNVQVQGITPDTGLSNNDGITNVRNISLLGRSDPNDFVQVYRNGVSIGTTTANAQGNWTFNYTGTSLANGSYNFAASASDVAGNVTALSQPYTVTIDTATPKAPVVSGLTESNGVNGNQTLTISGTAVAQSQVTVYLAGTAIGRTNVNGQGQWTFNYNANTTNFQFANGTYLFTAQIEDLAGNISPLSTPFQLLLGNGMQNLSAPQLTAASVLQTSENGNQTAIPMPTFTGHAQAGTLVTIVDNGVVLGTAVANSAGQWTFTCFPLAKGNQTISVFATDSLGDEGLLSNALTFQV